MMLSECRAMYSMVFSAALVMVVFGGQPRRADAGDIVYTGDQASALRQQIDRIKDAADRAESAEKGLKTFENGRAWWNGYQALKALDRAPIDASTGQLSEAAQSVILNRAETALAARGSAEAIGRIGEKIGAVGQVAEAAQSLNDFGKAIANNGLESSEPYAVLMKYAAKGAVALNPVGAAAMTVVGVGSLISPDFKNAANRIDNEYVTPFFQAEAEGWKNVGGVIVDKGFEVYDRLAESSRFPDPPVGPGSGSPISLDSPRVATGTSSAVPKANGDGASTSQSSSVDDAMVFLNILGAVAQGITSGGAQQSRPTPPATPPSAQAPRPPSAQAAGPPAGWVQCTCPDKHASYGQRFNGAVWHPAGIWCPH